MQQLMCRLGCVGLMAQNGNGICPGKRQVREVALVVRAKGC